MQFSFIIEYSWRVKMTLKHRQQHTTDARPRDDVPKVSIKDRKFLWHASECWGKRIQLLSSCDAINLHACLKRPKDLYAIVSYLVIDRVSIKDESRSDRCSPVGTKSVAIDKFKCNQGRPHCNKSDTVATTTTTSATTKFHGNTYMLLHLEARKEAIAPYVLQQRTKKFATQIRCCYIAVQKQPTLVWSP